MRVLRWIGIDAAFRAVTVFCVVFVGLNILDAWLTGVALGLGSSELNPLLSPTLASNVLFKGLLSAAIVVGLLLVRRGRLLKPLSMGMALVCAWNCLAIWSWM